MDDRAFEDRIDALFGEIEDCIDDMEQADDREIDIDTTAGMLTIDLADSGSIIVSRQIANHEVWIAAKSGGYHLSLDGEYWHCRTTGEELGALLDRVFTEQLGESIEAFKLALAT